MDENARFEQEMERWELLYDRVCDLLEKHGEEDSLRPGDYWVHDDYWGHPQVKVYIHNLALLNPSVVTALQALLGEFPGWEIVATVAVRGKESWPDMGLSIRQREIVDDLQRQFLPVQFGNFRYSRP